MLAEPWQTVLQALCTEHPLSPQMLWQCLHGQMLKKRPERQSLPKVT